VALGCGDAFRKDDVVIVVMDMGNFSTHKHQSHTSGTPKTTDAYIRTPGWYNTNESLSSTWTRMIRIFRRRDGDGDNLAAESVPI
jgi:hypothetical protein